MVNRWFSNIVGWLAVVVCLSMGRAEEVQIQILHTTDIHSHIALPPNTDAASKNSSGAMLQLGSLISVQRENFGKERTLLIDTGDTLQGTLVASLSKGQAGVQALLSMGYDVWVPGNHEFDFGIEHFFQLSEPLRPITLCGNLHPLKVEPYPAWKMFELGGARVAVIGATASYMRHWFIGEIESVCSVEMAAAMLERIMPDILAAKPDMIVLAIHQGILMGLDVRNVNEIYAIGRKFPEIDLILGGHTHLEFAGRKIGNRSWYVQPGAGAKCFAIVTATIDTEKHETVQIESFLRYSNLEGTPYYPPMYEVVAPWLAEEEQKGAEEICPPRRFAVTTEGTPGVSCQMSELIAKAIAEAVGADCALHGTLSAKILEADVPISFRDIYEVIPYENEIVEAWVTSEELAEIALEQWNQNSSYSYSGLYGAMLDVFVAGKGAKKTAVVAGFGEQCAPPEEGRRYKLALNSFTAAGSGRYPVLRRIMDDPESKMKKTGLAVREVVADYLKTHPDEDIRPVRWIRVKKERKE